MKNIYFLLFLILMSSCGFTEEDAEKLADDFLTSYKYKNEEKAKKLFPKFNSFRRLKEINTYNIEKTTKQNDNSFEVYGSYNDKKFSLYIRKVDRNLIIEDSKGFAYIYDENYKACMKLGCISEQNKDSEAWGIISKSCSDLEYLVNSILPIHFDIDKDIVIKEKRANMTMYSSDQYVEYTIENKSDLKLEGNHFDFSVKFKDRKGGVLDSYKLNNYFTNLLPGEKITISSNDNKFNYFYAPSDARSYTASFSLNTSNLIDLAITNKELFGLACK